MALRRAAAAGGLGVALLAVAVSSTGLAFTYPFSSCRVGQTSSFAIGEETYVCININGKVTSIYNVVTDSFAAISISASNFALPGGSGYIKAGEGWMDTVRANLSETSVFYATFDVASVGVFSPYPRIYKRLTFTPSDTGVASGDIITIPVYTAIIQMENGVVTDIGWDEGCLFCPENTEECTHSAFSANTSTPIADDTLRGCRKASADCYPETFTNNNAANGTDANVTLTDSACDLKVFLTWTGTDRNGQYLRSAGRRFSRYRAFGIATAYQSAINLATDAMQIGETAISEIKAVPGKILPGVNEEERRRVLLDEGHGGSEAARDEIGAKEWEEMRGHELSGRAEEKGFSRTPIERIPGTLRP